MIVNFAIIKAKDSMHFLIHEAEGANGELAAVRDEVSARWRYLLYFM